MIAVATRLSDNVEVHRSGHDSNGEACEVLAEEFNLTEEQHQALWDELALVTDTHELTVEGEPCD